ncbi:hypothetical protein ACROYT_G028278 [Oculina patagonica]
MAEGYTNSSFWPKMNWGASELSKERERFYQHCEFTFGGPLSKCTEREKICNQWETVKVGSGKSAQDLAIDIGRMFEATNDGMQVMSGEDPKVEVVNKLAWRDGSTKRSKTCGKQKIPKENNEQVKNSKTRNVNLLNEMQYPSEDYSSDEEGPGKEQQKYFYDRHGTKDLPPLKPGDPVKVKPEPGSKEWRAATVVQKHALPRLYVVDVGGRRIRRNRVARRIDSAKSHAEYQKCHPNSVQQPESRSGNPCTVPTFQADTQMEQPVQDHNPHPNNSSTSISPCHGSSTSFRHSRSQGLSPVHNSKWQTSQEAKQTKLVTKLP